MGQEGIERALQVSWLAFLLVWVVSARFTKKAQRRQSRASRVQGAMLGLVAAALVFWPQLQGGPLLTPFVPHSIVVAEVGVGLTIAGIAFAIWARAFLGRNWSGSVQVKTEHELIIAGPYAIVRHPIYTGILFALLGTAIVEGTVGGLVGVLIAVVTLRIKSRVEEHFMTEEFGDQYEAYKGRVRALVPFLW